MSSKKIVLVGGCFDILHHGHLHFLKSAKKLGDYLVVLLESDTRIKKLKGPTRPFNNQETRKAALENLKFVDQVILTKDVMVDDDYKNIVIKLNPQIIAITKGEKTKTHANLVNAKVIEINKIEGVSTTLISQGVSQPLTLPIH